MRNSTTAILITGTSSGIGRACALHFDKLGFKVYSGVRKTEDGEALKNLALKSLTPVIIDITDKAKVDAARQFIEKDEKYFQSFILLNNAGFGTAGPVEFHALEEMKKEMDLNLFGTVSVIQSFLPLLRRKKGRIVNISSVSGVSSLPFQGAYSATKFALEAMMDALRVELKPWGIPVSNIQPGDIMTPVWKKALDAANDMMEKWPAEALEMYGPVLEMMKKMGTEPRGILPEFVAIEAEKLIKSNNPKARVLVGKDAKQYALLEKLPTKLRDNIIYSKLPKYGVT